MHVKLYIYHGNLTLPWYHISYFHILIESVLYHQHSFQLWRSLPEHVLVTDKDDEESPSSVQRRQFPFSTFPVPLWWHRFDVSSRHNRSSLHSHVEYSRVKLYWSAGLPKNKERLKKWKAIFFIFFNLLSMEDTTAY